MGRVDYATMEALADLNYAMNRGPHAALPPWYKVSRPDLNWYSIRCLREKCRAACFQNKCLPTVLDRLRCLQRHIMVVVSGRAKEQLLMARPQLPTGRAAAHLTTQALAHALSLQHQRGSAHQKSRLHTRGWSPVPAPWCPASGMPTPSKGLSGYAHALHNQSGLNHCCELRVPECWKRGTGFARPIHGVLLSAAPILGTQYGHLLVVKREMQAPCACSVLVVSQGGAGIHRCI